MKTIDKSLGNSEATGLNICNMLFCSGLSFLPENISYLLHFQSVMPHLREGESN